MPVISMIHTKGGVGTSTLTCNLAVAAREATGGPVAIVDSDPQRTLAMWWHLREQARASRGEGAEEGIGVYADFESIEDAVEALRLNVSPAAMLVDTPPNMLRRVREAARVADLCILPLKPSIFDLHATRDAVAICREEKRPFRIVINDWHANESFADEVRDFLQADLGRDSVLTASVRHRAVYVSSVRSGFAAGEVRGAHLAKREMATLWAEISLIAQEAAHVS